MPARRITVTGRVQGVFFRASTRLQAEALGLTGWVRNEPDGSVAIFAEGPRAALDTLEEWCHHGPPAARVERVIAEEADEEGGAEFVSERG